MPVAVVITLGSGGLSSNAATDCLGKCLHARNSADAACTAGSALQSLVSSSFAAENKVIGGSAPDRSVYSGRRVLHTRWVITWILGAAVEVEAAKTKGIAQRNLRKIEWSVGLYECHKGIA